MINSGILGLRAFAFPTNATGCLKMESSTKYTGWVGKIDIIMHSLRKAFMNRQTRVHTSSFRITILSLHWNFTNPTPIRPLVVKQVQDCKVKRPGRSESEDSKHKLCHTKSDFYGSTLTRTGSFAAFGFWKQSNLKAMTVFWFQFVRRNFSQVLLELHSCLPTETLKIRLPYGLWLSNKSRIAR